MKYFSSVLKFPVGFSEAARPGSLQRVKMSRFGSTTRTEWYYSEDRKNSIVVSVDKPIKLYAVRLFGSSSKEYSVTLTVTDSNGVTLATKTGKFKSQFMQCETGDYQGFDVAFEPPVALQAGIQYSLGASIRGPAFLYREGGLSEVEHAGVTFYFANKGGAVGWEDTTVSQGQFPEFVFALN